jgi:hypothetical protein
MQPIMQPIPFTNQDPGVFIQTLSYLTIPSVGACRLVCSHWKQLLETKYQDGKLFVWQVVALSQLPSIDLNKIPDFPSYLRIHANLIDGVCFQRCLKDAGAPMILKGGVLFSAGAEDPRRQVNTARQVLKWDWRNGACLGAYEGHQNRIMSIAVTEDPKYLFSRDCRGTVKKWDTEKYTCLATCEEDSQYSCKQKALILVADKWFFTSHNNRKNEIKVWDAESCNHIDTISHPKEQRLEKGITSLSVDTGKRRLFVGYRDGSITVLDLDHLRSCIAAYKPDDSSFGCCPMVVKGNEVFFGCEIGHYHYSLLKRWDYEKNITTTLLGRHSRWGRPMAINETAGVLFSGFSFRFRDLRICSIDDLETTRGTRSARWRVHDCCMRQLLESDGVVFSASSKRIKVLDFTETRWRAILEDIARQMMHEYVPLEDQEERGMIDEKNEIQINEDSDSEYGGIWKEEGGDGSATESESRESDDEWNFASERFAKLPLTIQKAVFIELDKILKRDGHPNYNENPRDAFYNENGQVTTNKQRAEAIWAFLGVQMVNDEESASSKDNYGMDAAFYDEESASSRDDYGMDAPFYDENSEDNYGMDAAFYDEESASLRDDYGMDAAFYVRIREIITEWMQLSMMRKVPL